MGFLEMMEGMLALARLEREGNDESPEADEIRDGTDTHWETLDSEQKKRVRWIMEEIDLETEALIDKGGG
jgi:hypothetical protein